MFLMDIIRKSESLERLEISDQSFSAEQTRTILENITAQHILKRIKIVRLSGSLCLLSAESRELLVKFIDRATLLEELLICNQKSDS